MKKLLSILLLCFFLTSCFGKTETESKVEVIDEEQNQEVIVPDVVTETEVEPEVPGKTVDESKEEVQIKDAGAENQEYDVRSNIENDAEATIIEPETKVIPTAPVEKTESSVIEPSKSDSELGDEVVDEFEDELNELFDLLESDG